MAESFRGAHVVLQRSLASARCSPQCRFLNTSSASRSIARPTSLLILSASPRFSAACTQQAGVRSFYASAVAHRVPPRDPLEAEREAGTVAGNRHARAKADALAAEAAAKQQSGSGGSNSGGKNGGSDGGRPSLTARMADSWRRTPVTWYPIPILLGAIVLVGVQARRNYVADMEASGGAGGKRGKIVDENGQVVTMSGPWTVYVLGALPLNAISRLWGWANNLTLPVWFRPMGFRLYARIFGCNLDEMKDKDLTHYSSLGEFFYRELVDGSRAIDDEAPIVSPADGTVLHFGTIQGRRVEQVKGITYSLDALLGLSSDPQGIDEAHGGPGSQLDEKQFAAINGIDYSLDRLLGDEKKPGKIKRFVSWRWWKSKVWGKSSKETATPATTGGSSTPIPQSRRSSDAEPGATKEQPSSDDSDDEDGDISEAGVETPDSPEILSRYASVAYEMGSGALPPFLQRHSPVGHQGEGLAEGNRLHFAVIYLAPGDYHRFHSPTNWVAERRRHFRGELYSVSPYIANRLGNLFILNERVALLGRWRYGFFSMIPVGATNVGSIRINFDTELRTNVKEQRPLAGTYSEASYGKASRLLGGQPLSKGEEMGGFLLGSTIVLVWESPEFAFEVKPGQKVKVGERLGDLGRVAKGEREEPEAGTRQRKWYRLWRL